MKDAIERNRKENWLFNGDVWKDYRGKYLQVHVTVEDAGVFTSPFTATLTYVPNPNPLQEAICAENNLQFDYHMPEADRPDF